MRHWVTTSAAAGTTWTPADVGLPTATGRRRVPGLRRTELAARAGISVEYLTRLEQGRDRNPTDSVLTAIADALALDLAERRHLVYLAKTGGDLCRGHREPEPMPREVGAATLRTLVLLEPGVAAVVTRLGDVLARTSGFDAVFGATGLLDPAEPNLTTYVFTDQRAREVFADWEAVADRQAYDLWWGPSRGIADAYVARIAPRAGSALTARFGHQAPPVAAPIRLRLDGVETRWDIQALDVVDALAQQLLVWHPADEATARSYARLHRHGSRTGASLRAL